MNGGWPVRGKACSRMLWATMFLASFCMGYAVLERHESVPKGLIHGMEPAWDDAPKGARCRTDRANDPYPEIQD